MQSGRDLTNFAAFYNLESYLFDTVSPRFEVEGSLGAFDFFAIVIWKSNRAKPHVARRLLSKGHEDLEGSARALTREIHDASDEAGRFDVVVGKWGFALPMGSSILTVLYPDEFTVFDVRACEILGGEHARLANRSSLAGLWDGYVRFREAVRASGPQGISLRDKDRWLWGKSAALQLERDIERAFGVPRGQGSLRVEES